MKQNFEVTGVEYSVFKFPAGEVQVTLTSILVPSGCELTITGSVTSSDNIMELLMVVDALRRDGFDDLYLIMPYCAYSRQDRVCNRGESFSLKVFTNLINSCEFKGIITYDNHSDVTTALLDNCSDAPVHMILQDQDVLDVTKYDAVVSPDAGANKKVFKCAQMFNVPMIRADKVRNTRTGAIMGTDVYVQAEDIKDTRILIIDDICEGGRTFIELAKALKTIEPTVTIDLFVTHGFFSKGMEGLQEAGISQLYTTDSVREVAGPGLELIPIGD